MMTTASYPVEEKAETYVLHDCIRLETRAVSGVLPVGCQGWQA